MEPTVIPPIPLKLTRPIRLIVADLDGCLTTGGQRFADLAVFHRLQQLLRNREEDPAIPALSFNTGRPQPYVECMQRMLGTTSPALCEAGLVLWDPSSRRLHLHPQYSEEDEDSFHRFLKVARRWAARANATFALEGGKRAQATLLPIRPRTTDELEPLCRSLIAESETNLVVEKTRAVLNILPPHLDKGTGMQWLLDLAEASREETATIGDSDADWQFMRHSAVSWTPANADADLRHRATHASKHGPGHAVVELLESVIAANRALG